MRIGVPKESRPGETRVAATPKTVRQLIGLGYEVVIERGAGTRANFSDAAYKDAGAPVVDDHEAWSSDVVLKINAPTDEEVARLRPGAILASLLAPALSPDLVERLTAQGVTALAMDAVPRISRAQSLDVLSSMANIGGYRAVVEPPMSSAASSPGRSPRRARCRRRRCSSSAQASRGSRRSVPPAASAPSSGPSTPVRRSASRSSRWGRSSSGSRARSRRARARPATPRRWARTSTGGPPSSTPSRPRTSTSSSRRR